MSFIEELKRRNVIRVALAYMAGAWLVIQIADTMIEGFLWPPAWLGIVITVLAVGFIPAVVFAWAFELTPDGLKRDDGDSPSPPRKQIARRFDRLVMVALALAVVYFVIDEIYFERVISDRSVAVLPFVNLSDESAQQFFADGVAGAVLQILSEDNNLQVTSWSTTQNYRGDIDAADVADELGVSYILEGAVQRGGEAIRISVRLVDAVKDIVVWSDDWDRELVDIFEVQDEIATKVARNLRVELIRRHRDLRETDPETYDLYLRARKLWYESELNSADRSTEIRLLDQALERDPEYVPAMTLLAVMLSYAEPEDAEKAAALSRRRMELIDRAYELDPEDGVATLYKGWNVSQRTGDIRNGIPYLETALRLEPSNPEILRMAGLVGSWVGHGDDAVMLLDESIRRHPRCQQCYANLGQVLWGLGRLEEAADVYRRRLSLDIDEVDYGAHINIALINLQLGRTEGVSETIEKYEPGENARAYLRALIADAEGRRSEADELLATARARFGDSPFQLASFYAGRGDAEQTLNWVGKFIESYPGSAPIVLSNNSFSFVFDTPEWQEWRRQFNMHPEQLAEIEFDIPDFN